MNKTEFVSIIVIFLCFGSASAIERDLEIRNEMWSSRDKNFGVSLTPAKWSDKSAIVIAQLNRFEYRRMAMLASLKFNEYNHYRIKLNDVNAVTKYSEIAYSANRYDKATGENKRVYVGFKVVKPGGKEVIIDLAKAVKMDQRNDLNSYAYSKIAISGLEPGDILDYYICEETTMPTSTLIHFFEPVIYQLPREYPVLNQKLQFRAARRCFINVVSLNGAPELKLEADDENDEQYYTLEGKEIDGVEDQRWLFPYRELPSIKFRAAYASGKGMRTFDVLLGEPGIAKSSVSKKEVEDMAATMLATSYDIKSLNKFAKTKLKNIKDPFEIARQAYYFYRNRYFDSMEGVTVGGGRWPEISELNFTDGFSTFLASKKIEHDIIIAIPRNISSLNNLLMEAEIEWMIRVKKGSEYLYLSPFDINTVAGFISPLLEGTEAYALNGLSPRGYDAKKITIPVSSSEVNQSAVLVEVDLLDLNKAKVAVKKTLSGVNKFTEQYGLMDLYDYEAEERERFIMEESFAEYGSSKKRFIALKDTYMSKRVEAKAELLKQMSERDYNVKVQNTGNLKVEQTGRYDTKEAMIYSFSFETEDLVKKTGPNFLVDAGKLIEQQTKVKGEELNRTTNVYFENARSFSHKITLNIPAGYTVQGLDRLNVKLESKWGGFTSSAKEENGKIVLECYKHYDFNFVPKEEWSKVVDFLNAAYEFSEQKILLKKK
ncbi:MAG: DUF3857 domain-containing protein [Chryseolinea sp.]